MYLLGVLGMLMYSASRSDPLVRQPAKGDNLLLCQHLENCCSSRCWRSSGCSLRGLGDYMANHFPGWVTVGARRAVRALHGCRRATTVAGGDAGAHHRQYRTGAGQYASLTILIRDSITVAALVAYIFWHDRQPPPRRWWWRR
jgi:hypothetical protein